MHGDGFFGHFRNFGKFQLSARAVFIVKHILRMAIGQLDESQSGKLALAGTIFDGDPRLNKALDQLVAKHVRGDSRHEAG